MVEISKPANYRRGALLWCMDGRANPLMDWKVVGVSGYLSVHLPVYLSIFLSVCLSDKLSLWLPVYLSVYLSICVCVDLSVYLSIHLSIYTSIYLSIYLSICLSKPPVVRQGRHASSEKQTTCLGQHEFVFMLAKNTNTECCEESREAWNLVWLEWKETKRRT